MKFKIDFHFQEIRFLFYTPTNKQIIIWPYNAYVIFCNKLSIIPFTNGTADIAIRTEGEDIQSLDYGWDKSF